MILNSEVHAWMQAMQMTRVWVTVNVTSVDISSFLTWKPGNSESVFVNAAITTWLPIARGLNSHDPTQSFGTFWWCWLANWRKSHLRHAHRSASLSLPGRAAAHSLLFLWLTQKPLQKPEFIRSGWKPLLSWPLFSGGTLRGVLTSGLNEGIRQVGHLTGLPVTKFSTIGAKVQFCWVKLKLVIIIIIIFLCVRFTDPHSLNRSVTKRAVVC